MDDTNENSRTANQAWRKRPRKFAPKSRLGCKTCKIRRVKCDLSQPSCSKCRSTGRTCDGYGDLNLAFGTEKTDIESSRFHNQKTNSAESDGDYYPCTTMSACQSEKLHARKTGLSVQDLGPFMVLPVTGSTQARAMWFFEHASIRDMNEYHPCESWRKTLMFFSQTVPSVRHAAMALALIHRQHMDRDSSDRVHLSQFSQGWLSDKAPLFHYNRAIELLLNYESDDSTQTTAVTLLVCYLFICFDHLACNYVQAIKHLRGGVDLSRNINKAITNRSSTHDDAHFSGGRTLICQVTKQIRRLDMQAGMFLIDWTPGDIQETFTPQLSPCDIAFQSLEQAADHLQVLTARVMSLRNTEQEIFETGQMPESPDPFQDVVLEHLEKWSSLFERMLQQSGSCGPDSETDPLIPLLRLHYTMAWILLSSHGIGREMDYDDFLPQFMQCMGLVDDVAAARERFSGSLKPKFTPEIGTVPLLYMIGAKCRHPTVRREAVRMLRRQPIREAVWNSITAAKVVEGIIDIEESELREDDKAVSMAQISVWQRIETLSFIHVISEQSAGRVDITYTFCGREGTYTESLMM